AGASLSIPNRNSLPAGLSFPFEKTLWRRQSLPGACLTRAGPASTIGGSRFLGVVAWSRGVVAWSPDHATALDRRSPAWQETYGRRKVERSGDRSTTSVFFPE